MGTLLPCFQVGRFGSKSSNSQKILKSLDAPFTALIGELVLESMTFNESSHVVTGVDAIANTVWGAPLSAEESASTFRFVLLITDGEPLGFGTLAFRAARRCCFRCCLIVLLGTFPCFCFVWFGGAQ
jgi:hypothetical protein